MVNFPSTTAERKFRGGIGGKVGESLPRCEQVASFPHLNLYLSTVREGGSRSCDQNLSNERRNLGSFRRAKEIVNRPPLKRFEDFAGWGGGGEERRRVRGRQLNNGG